MEQITKYKAFDGVEFLEAIECEEHEVNCKLADVIMRALPARPDSCDFSNGDGHIQHDPVFLLKTRNKFLEFARRYTNHKWIQETIDKGWGVDASWVARILSETAPNSVYKHWYRFSCVDSSHREWGQPYYSANPTEGKGKRLNP